MLARIRDDTWNVLNIQHMTPNSKRWAYSDAHGGGHKRWKDPPTWLTVTTTLEKAPNHHPRDNNKTACLCTSLNNGSFQYGLQREGFPCPTTDTSYNLSPYPLRINPYRDPFGV